MKFINYPIIKFSVAYVLGICLAHLGFAAIEIPYYSLLLFPLLLLFSWWIFRKKLRNPLLFGPITLLFFTSLGILNYQSRTPLAIKNHYVHSSLQKTPQLISLEISDVLKSSDYYDKYIVQVLEINNATVRGKALLLLQKEETNSLLQIDNQLMIYGSIEPIARPLNPNQFDYKGYLQNQEVYGEIKGEASTLVWHKNNTTSLKGFASLLRKNIIQKLDSAPLQPEERSIIQALLLGDKKDIDKELYADYAAAGAVHILAVSGLHVGVLYFLLGGLFSFLKRIPKGRYIHPLLVVALLWGFAFITGLSPSVTRAVTMFSFFGLAQLLNKRTSTINTLALSFLFLLLIKPLWLFHVGFQLSYLAVFFIVWTVPLLSKIYTPSTWIGKRLWDIIYVSIAAQLGVFPLSLYYFHQFPGLFLISNILVLPLLGLLLGGGVFIIVLLLLDWVPDVVISSYGYIISILNKTIQWIASKDTFLLKDISFSLPNALAFYAIICTGILLLRTLEVKRMYWLLGSVLLFVTISGIEKTTNNTNELLVFHKTKHTIIGEKSSDALRLFTSDTLTSIKDTYPISNFALTNGINNVTKQELPAYFIFNNQPFMVIDSSGFYVNNPKKSTLLLTQSPKIHLGKLIDSIQPEQIIADGSNYTSYIKRWQKTCVSKKIPFHYTGEKGAFILVAE